MIFDLHNDFPTAFSPREYRKYLDGCGKNTVTAAIWTSDFDKDTARGTVDAITNSLRSCGKNRAVHIAIEDLGFLTDAERFEFDFSPYIYCSLTWNYNNRFAGGALDDGDLTRLGKDVIELMNGKCAIDLAHLNKKSFYSALEYAARPICSHTGFADHPRCLDARQIRALISAGGIIGLCTVSAFSSAASAEEFAAAIDAFVQKYGADNLALGTDFNGSKDIPDDLCDYAAIQALAPRLVALGYDEPTLQKIFYSNAFNFFTENKHG
ncbi:MAG: membrane dipeptidase [Roseburia sp.]|nr:membrane dipeptidase [Roseburia sp.]